MPDPAPSAAIASPLNLLREEESAREVLLLSYTLNLEFWERYALSVARGLGARVTVVGDSAMVHGDPAHIRYAGITYLDGRAACKSGGAFHPKLLVIAGDDYATVAIGSGNATISGWHDNAEIWTVLRGDSTGAPDTFAALSTWLRALPEHVRFSGAVEGALARVAELIDALPNTDRGPQLLSSLPSALLDQVDPLGAVDELVIASPFYDRRGTALASLFDRFAPKRARILLQPRDLVADGTVLAGMLAAAGRSAESIAGERYHHGKLIEWTTTDSRRFALTGSPNLSAPALLRSLSEGGGNCELALLVEIEETLAPPSGGGIELEQLASISFDPRYEAPPALALLGVMLGPDRVAVTLGRPLAEEAFLEYLQGAAWEIAAVVPAGVETFEAEVLLAAGTAVRLRRDALVSNVCFIADPSRFVRTRVEHVGRVSTDEDEIFRDPSVADAFAHDLAELRQYLAHAPRSAPASGGRGDGRHKAAAFRSWEEYLDACEAQIGPRLLAYGLALPALDSNEGLREEQETGTLTDETGEEAAPQPGEGGAGGEEPHPAPRFEELSDNQRRRYQRWCERLAELSPELPYAGRLVVLRLILDAVRGELFPTRERWLPLVASATQALGAETEGFDEEHARAASLASVALAAMRSKLPRFADWEDLRFPYERAADAVLPLLENREGEAIARYSAPLEAFFGPAVQPALVEVLVESLLLPDPIAVGAHRAEQELMLTVERRDNVIEIDTRLDGDARRTLLTIISYCENAPVAVRTAPWNETRSYAVWRPPDLVLVMPLGTGVRGAHYTIRGFPPGAYRDDIAGLPKPKHEWRRESETPDEVMELVKAAGL